jgi:preprotein translocase subunit SecY
MTVLTLTTGTAFVMWLGEQITERGIGNGMSLIIYAGIVVGLPSAVFITLDQVQTGQIGLLTMIVLLVMMIAVIAAIGGSRSSTPSASSGAGSTAARARTSR